MVPEVQVSVTSLFEYTSFAFSLITFSFSFLLSAALDGGTAVSDARFRLSIKSDIDIIFFFFKIMIFVYTFAVGGGSGKVIPFPTWALVKGFTFGYKT